MPVDFPPPPFSRPSPFCLRTTGSPEVTGVFVSGLILCDKRSNDQGMPKSLLTSDYVEAIWREYPIHHALTRGCDTICYVFAADSAP